MIYPKHGLGLLIAGLLVSSQGMAAEVFNKDGNKLDLTGKVDARHVISDNSSENGDNAFVRFGFKGQTQISNDLTGFGRWESQVAANKTEGGSDAQNGTVTRFGFAGIKSASLGSIDYGRNVGVLYDAIGYTDFAPIYGSSTYSQDNFMSKRSTGLFTYRSPDLAGFKLTLQYQGKNDRTQATKSNGDGFGTALTYALSDKISLAGAYTKSKRTLLQQQDGQGDDATAWATAVKYDNNQVYLAAMYSQSKDMNPYGQSQIADKTRTVEIIAQYQFLNGLRPSVGFVSQWGDNLQRYDEFSGGDQTIQKYIALGSYYYFNKNMLAYVDYKLNLLKDNTFTKETGVSTKDSLGMGLVYQF
ncbi:MULTISPECIES: porin [Erwiniaceae]|uniref:porin n=1 Tax=Erwiniaceae TaxID=1903409 RepID=UPI00190C0ADC|nr:MULTISPECIES: porin [Erwiniaceae]MBK0093429.1 porin [Erwinia sp. S59]MBK0123693.1 porin [Pantoea sp. S61]